MRTYGIRMNIRGALEVCAPTGECDSIPQRGLAFRGYLHETGGQA